MPCAPCPAFLECLFDESIVINLCEVLKTSLHLEGSKFFEVVDC